MKALNEVNKKELRSILQNATTRESLKNDPYGYLVKTDYIPYKIDLAKYFVRKWRNENRKGDGEMSLLEWVNKNKKLIDMKLNNGRDLGNIDRMASVKYVPELRAMAIKDGVNFESWTCKWSN